MTGAFSALLVGASVLGWVAIGSDLRARFSVIQVLTLIIFLVFMVGGLLVVGTSYVRADATGLSVRNALRRHDLAWEQIRDIRFGQGGSWAYAYLRPSPDGPERLMLLGIQGVDGARARRLLDAVRACRPEAESGQRPA